MKFPIWRNKREEDLEKELRSHLEMSIEDRFEHGETAEHAVVRARRCLGNEAHIREITREVWGWMWLERLGQDLRYGIRALIGNPGFTIVAVITLALGIGANTTIFSFVNSIILRPLPLKDSDRLVEVWENNLQRGINRMGPSGPTFLDWQSQSKSFEDMALFEIGSGTFTGQGEPQQIPALRVTTNFLSLLGAKAELGRLFLPEEGSGGRQNVVIISNSLWQKLFSSDPRIIGRSAEIDGISYTVIGVLSPKFNFPVASEGYVPWPNDELRQRPRDAHDFGVCGHLRPGVTVATANAELNTINNNLARNFREMENWGVTVVPFQKVMAEYISPALLVLFCAVGFVLLITCTNIATLLIARGAARQKEIAIRSALGASRLRLIRQFLTESLLLSLAGGAFGLLMSIVGTSVLKALLPQQIPIPDAGANALLPNVDIDTRVLLFTLLVSLVTSVFFGGIPAVAVSKANLGSALKEGGKGSTAGHQFLRNVLVVAEVMLAMVLLVSAGLMMHGFLRLGQVNPGFQTDHLLTVEIELPTDTKYKEGPEQSSVFDRFLQRVKAIPGVRSAALTQIVPLMQREDPVQFVVNGSESIDPGQRISAQFRTVSPDYFHTLGVPLIKGRDFDDYDLSDSQSVVIIDEKLMRAYWPQENPIGQHIRFNVTGRLREIVGVVGSIKQDGLDHQDTPMIYTSFKQTPTDRMNLVVRTTGTPATLASDVKAAVWAVDKDQPVYNIKTMDDIISETKSTPRLSLTLMIVFAGLALLLATVGIYGVVSYSVTQSAREIGIRMALGAQPGDVLKLIVGNGMVVTLIGVAVGLALSFAIARILTSVLFGVSSADVTTFSSVAFLLTVVALLASYIPARRATRIDPIIALRSE